MFGLVLWCEMGLQHIDGGHAAAVGRDIPKTKLVMNGVAGQNQAFCENLDRTNQNGWHGVA